MILDLFIVLKYFKVFDVCVDGHKPITLR